MRTSRTRRTRRTGAIALALAAALVAGCAGTASGPATDLEDPTSPPDAPGVEPTSPDGADVTAAQIGLPTLELTNRRGYAYAVTVEISRFATEIELADPGRTRLLVEAQFDLAVANLLDDRPAPFVVAADDLRAVQVDLLFPMDEELATWLHEQRTRGTEKRDDSAPSLAALDIGGLPFLRSVPRSLGSSLATAGRSLGDLEASEVAVWEIWTVPFGLGPDAARAPSAAFGDDLRGWSEERIAQLAAVMDSAPAYVRLELGGDLLDSANCRASGGDRRLVHYYDVAAGVWLTPEQMPWDTGCSPSNWKQTEAEAEADAEDA